MAPLLPFATSTSIGPLAAVMFAGFLIGVVGHLVRSRTMILTGIVIVGALSAYVAFGVAKIA